MKFTALRDKLLNAALIAERMVGKKESLPVLSCIHLSVGKDLVMQATNLEAGVRLRVLGESSEKGEAAIPSSVFIQTLRSTSSDKITLSREGQNVLVTARGTRTLIKAVSHEEFPSISDRDVKRETHTIPRAVFMRSIQSVSYAASPSMIRPELGSVLLSFKDDTLTSVATDSFRLAEKTSKCPGKGAQDILLPLKHAHELVHVLERVSDEMVSLSAEDSELRVTSEFVTFVSRVVEGAFPNYREVIPKSFQTEAVILKADVADMLRKARVFAGGEQRVGLHLYPKKKIFSATAQSAEIGEMSDSLEAALSGEDLDIFFNISYLSDCLQSIDSDSLTLSFAGTGKPLVVRGVSDQTFLYLVMPLNR